MTSSRRSLRPLSLSPHVRSTRLAITAGSPTAATQVGQDGPLDHVLHLVRHARHGVDDLVDRRPTGQISPGAVPRVCGMTVAPTGHHAPGAGCSRPSRRPRDGEHLADRVGDVVVGLQLDAHHRGDRLAGEVVVGRPEAAAHDHRIGLGEQARAARPRCGRVVADLHLAAASRCRRRRAARRSTTSWCRRSGRAAARCRRRPRRSACQATSHGAGASGSGVRRAAPQVLRAADHGEHDGDPQEPVPQPRRRRARSAAAARSRRRAAGRASCTWPACWPAR